MSATQTKPSPTTRPETKTHPPRQWNVVLIDDDDHSYEYVIRLMQTVFHASPERGYKIAQTVDNDGRAVCITTHREHAELKREQILSFGRDPLLMRSKGPMTAVLEPAECGGDDDDADHGGRA